MNQTHRVYAILAVAKHADGMLVADIARLQIEET